MPCEYVYVDEAILLTQQEVSLLRCKGKNDKLYSETTLTIDDLGVIRLTCLSNNNINIANGDSSS